MEWAAVMPSDAETFRGLRAKRTSKRKLLFQALWRWVVASLLLGSICIVLSVYSKQEVMDKTSKRVFNAIVTGLSMILGLAVMEGLEKVARDVRWWILSRRPRSRQKVERILQADSMLQVLRLAIRSRRWSIHLTALFWVSLLLSAQAAIASLGLLYSVEKASTVALYSPGNVSIPDMSHFTTDRVVKSPTSHLSGQQYAANSYGTMSQVWSASTDDNRPKPGNIGDSDDSLIFCGRGHCEYVFYEFSTASLNAKSELSISVSTTRSVNATSECISWPVVEGGKGRDDQITFRTNEGNETLSLPVKAGIDQTTFMTNITMTCGDGCSTVLAFEASDTSPWYYICNVTVGDVVNASRPEHHVAAQLRQLAAAGIALQGYDTMSFVNDTQVQYRIYPAESIFGFPANGSTDTMADILNQFSAGAIAMAAEVNQKLVVFGESPYLGVTLQVEHWGYIVLIFIFVAGVQLLLGVLAALIASRVVMPEGGTVAEAQVVRSMGPDWASFRPQSCESAEGKEYWIYRYQEVHPGIYDLYMEEVSQSSQHARSNVK